jgi:hypothetical protein
MDEQPAALRAQVRENRSGNTERAHEVYIHLMDDLLLGESFGKSNRHQPGIVDHYIKPFGFLQNVANGSLDGARLPDVHVHRAQREFLISRQALKS